MIRVKLMKNSPHWEKAPWIVYLKRQITALKSKKKTLIRVLFRELIEPGEIKKETILWFYNPFRHNYFKLIEFLRQWLKSKKIILEWLLSALEAKNMLTDQGQNQELHHRFRKVKQQFKILNMPSNWNKNTKTKISTKKMMLLKPSSPLGSFQRLGMRF